MTPKAQNHAAATYCNMLDRDSGRIDWQLPSETILRMARAYTPWPGIWTTWTDGRETLRVKLFLPTATELTHTPGSLKEFEGHLLVGTGTTAILVSEMQLEGKKRMTVEELLAGKKEFTKGTFV
jgi:methionyl-tRNA formyltransferase